MGSAGIRVHALPGHFMGDTLQMGFCTGEAGFTGGGLPIRFCAVVMRLLGGVLPVLYIHGRCLGGLNDSRCARIFLEFRRSGFGHPF